MKTFVLILVLITSLFACKSNRQPANEPKKETPAALKEDSRVTSSFLPYKSNRNDLVDELYIDLVKETQNLKDIEDLIEENNTQKDDILKQYTLFNNKNHSYYNAAQGQAQDIKDTILRKKMLELIGASSEKYSSKTANLEAIIKHIAAKSASIQDYHTAMKIVVTMPLIENYQRDYLPKDSMYRGINKQQDQIITRMDKVIKK